jgi:hypothetical protein
MTAKTTKPSPATLAAVLDYLAQDPVLANAMRSVGMAPNTVFVWAKLSREGDERFKLAWPDPNGTPIWFHDGIVLARQMQCAAFEAVLRRDVTNGTPRVLRTPDGMPVWEVDPLAVSQWKNAEDAYALGGIVDWPYVHDQQGARIPVTVYDQAPAALRQHAARSLLAGYNPQTSVDVNTKHSGGVMIVRATRQGADTAPPYARSKMASEVAPMSPLKADLLKRLEDLRANGPANPKPSAPIQVFGRPSDDPPEAGATDARPRAPGRGLGR